MNIYFKTNLDRYKTNCFPTNLTQVPRVGDKILVERVFIKFYENLGLPIFLEVVDVYWSSEGVICELWFSKNSMNLAEAKGVNLLNL